MTEKTEITIKGLHCVDCVKKVEKGLSSPHGVRDLHLNFTTGKLNIEYESSETSLDEIYAKIRSLGHEVLEEEMEEEENLFTLSNGRFVLTLISGISLFTGLLLEHVLEQFVTDPLLFESVYFYDIHASGILFFIAMLSGGYLSLRNAIVGLMNKVFVIDSLMLIGAIGAVLLGEFSEGGAVLFLFSLAGLLEDYSVDRSRRSLRELVGLKPGAVFLKKNGGIEEVSADEVRVGDIALVRPGERIGVDGIVVEGCSMVNQAPITGESMPLDKDPGDRVFTGTINQDGRLEIRVEKEAKDSALARIIQMVESAEEHKAETERFVNRFSKYFTPSVVIMAIFVATVPALLLGQSFGDWFYKALLLLIISCPCALAISTPISIVSGITNGAKKGILFKGGAHLEKLERIDTFAFDKTGTLTEGKPAVTDVIPLNGHTRTEIITTAASLESLSKHPLGNAIVELAHQERMTMEPVTDLHEKTGKGIEGMIHGERFMVGSSRLFQPSALNTLEEPDNGGSVLSRLEDQAKTAVIVGRPGEVMGVIGITDRIRNGAKKMVQNLRELGIIHIVMVTGDNERTGRAVAREVGIDEYYTELLPEAKVEVIEKLMQRSSMSTSTTGQNREKGKKQERRESGVAMVGDGVNDAPALVTADIGIAMGAAGSDTALEVADIALMDEELSKLPTLLTLGRKTMAIIKQNIVLAIGVKLLFAILVFPGYVTLWMAVAIGDMGVSLAVISNALRLTRSDKDPGSEMVKESADREFARETDIEHSGVAGGITGACSESVCTAGCCGGDENGEKEHPERDQVEQSLAAQSQEEHRQEGVHGHVGEEVKGDECHDACCGGDDVVKEKSGNHNCHDTCCSGTVSEETV